MERKTQVQAGDGQQDLTITRDFDLPVALLYKAYTEAQYLEQWMGTKVLKLDQQAPGGYLFETNNAQGQVVFRANGALHEIIPDECIVRTFEMENAPFGAQLEFLTFTALSPDTSRLTIQSIFRTAALRDQQLAMPFAYGLNMAHNRLQAALAQR